MDDGPAGTDVELKIVSKEDGMIEETAELTSGMTELELSGPTVALVKIDESVGVEKDEL